MCMYRETFWRHRRGHPQRTVASPSMSLVKSFRQCLWSRSFYSWLHSLYQIVLYKMDLKSNICSVKKKIVWFSVKCPDVVINPGHGQVAFVRNCVFHVSAASHVPIREGLLAYYWHMQIFWHTTPWPSPCRRCWSKWSKCHSLISQMRVFV